MNGRKRPWPPTQTHHQSFHWPGAAAAAFVTWVPCAARNAWSALGTAASARSREVAAVGVTLNAVAISPTALACAAVSAGLADRAAWVPGSITARVASCCGYVAEIVAAWVP